MAEKWEIHPFGTMPQMLLAELLHPLHLLALIGINSLLS
jgi:hypothetical protein